MALQAETMERLDHRRAARSQEHSATRQKHLANASGVAQSTVSRWPGQSWSPFYADLRTVREFTESGHRVTLAHLKALPLCAEDRRLDPWHHAAELIVELVEASGYRDMPTEELVALAWSLADVEDDLDGREDRASRKRHLGRDEFQAAKLLHVRIQLAELAVDYALEERGVDPSQRPACVPTNGRRA